MKRILIVIFVLFSCQTFAGSNVAYLVCKSPSGRTLFKAKLQDIISFNEGTFTIDGESVNYNRDLYSSVIFNPSNKVFTISLQTKGTDDGWIKFYAIPSSFQVIKDGQHDQHYKFKAIIQGKDPRPDNYNSPEIEIDCELTYSI